MRVRIPSRETLHSIFGVEDDLSTLQSIPAGVAPRLAELQRLTEPEAELALALRPDGVIVGRLEGDEEALRHLRFSAEGRVARGRGEPALYVATVEELPPF